MATRQAKARLRKTFRYPAGNDGDDDQPEAMDEQEQESLIARLTADNASRNGQFRAVLLALPVIATLPYITTLLRLPTSSKPTAADSPPTSATLLSLLAVTSLLSTAFLLHRLPPTQTGIPLVDAWIRGDESAPGAPARDIARNAVGSLPGSRSPLELYLPYLNLGLVLSLALMGVMAGSPAHDYHGGSVAWVGKANLPALVYVVVQVAKVVMGSIDPEKELSALRYEFKGA